MTHLYFFTILMLSSCKPEKIPEDLSGSYEFTFTGNSYWCENYKVNGKDSILLMGYFWYTSQPFTKIENAELRKLGDKHYSVCLDNRVDCNNPLFKSEIYVTEDSIDFGKFCMFDSSFTVISMKGKKNNSEFNGKFKRYHNIYIHSSSNPHDYIYIGDFTLKRK